jgi:hypothetical protein
MFHTDPTFRSLILALAESDPPELDRVGVLADLLEERGDARTAKVREFRVHEIVIRSQPGGALMAVHWGIHPNYRQPPFGWSLRNKAEIEMIRHVLALFPEGPRWEAGFLTPFQKPFKFLTPREAHVDITVTIGGTPVTLGPKGPLWSDPPL